MTTTGEQACTVCGLHVIQERNGTGWLDMSGNDHEHTQTVTLWVCSCCLMAEASDGCDDCDHDREPLSAIVADDSIESVTLGLSWSEHSEDCPNRESESWDSECDCETRSFSWSRCDGCGSPLGGSRHAMTAWLR